MYNMSAFLYVESDSPFFLIFCRHRKNKEAANELLSKLKDNRELQHFLQDGQEVKCF